MLRNLVFWYNEAYGPINNIEDKKNKRKNFSAPYIKPMVTFERQQGIIEKMSRYGSRILRKWLKQDTNINTNNNTEVCRERLFFENSQCNSYKNVGIESKRTSREMILVENNEKIIKKC